MKTKIQIRKFSPHQNAKVFGILIAVTSLFFIVPMMLFMAIALPDTGQNGISMGFPLTMLLVMPVMYLVMTYISVSIGSIIYNFLVKYIGGIEYESEEKDV